MDDLAGKLGGLEDAKLGPLKDAIESELAARENRARLAASINAAVHDMLGAGLSADDIRRIVEAAIVKEYAKD